MNVGNEPPSSSSLPLNPPTPLVVPFAAQASAPPLPISSTALPSVLDAPEPIGSGGTSAMANLVKPSYFTPQSSSGLVMLPVATPPAVAVAPLHVPLTIQRPYGTPLLQPFPPPKPSPSLTPPTSYAPIITKDKVRDALSRLLQVFSLQFAFLFLASCNDITICGS